MNNIIHVVGKKKFPIKGSSSTILDLYTRQTQQYYTKPTIFLQNEIVLWSVDLGHHAREHFIKARKM